MHLTLPAAISRRSAGLGRLAPVGSRCISSSIEDIALPGSPEPSDGIEPSGWERVEGVEFDFILSKTRRDCWGGRLLHVCAAESAAVPHLHDILCWWLWVSTSRCPDAGHHAVRCSASLETPVDMKRESDQRNSARLWGEGGSDGTSTSNRKGAKTTRTQQRTTAQGPGTALHLSLTTETDNGTIGP